MRGAREEDEGEREERAGWQGAISFLREVV